MSMLPWGGGGAKHLPAGRGGLQGSGIQTVRLRWVGAQGMHTSKGGQAWATSNGCAHHECKLHRPTQQTCGAMHVEGARPAALSALGPGPVPAPATAPQPPRLTSTGQGMWWRQ